MISNFIIAISRVVIKCNLSRYIFQFKYCFDSLKQKKKFSCGKLQNNEVIVFNHMELKKEK